MPTSAASPSSRTKLWQLDRTAVFGVQPAESFKIVQARDPSKEKVDYEIVEDRDDNQMLNSATLSEYRELTSPQSARKQTQAACLALLAQIHLYEEAFMQVHGRLPTDVFDRAPMTSTYRQYKKWKRALQFAAACRIQTLIRGEYCRQRLLRLKNPCFTSVVLKRAGLVAGSEPVKAQLADLQARKIHLKAQLKLYDVHFVHTFGRMPRKAEKEPIRPLYALYQTVKQQIALTKAQTQGCIEPTDDVSVQEHQLSSGCLKAQTMHNKVKVYLASVLQGVNSFSDAGRGQDLAALKEEKMQLHTMLRSFEKLFFFQNQRQVNKLADIKPMLTYYRRLKEVRKTIVLLQKTEQQLALSWHNNMGIGVSFEVYRGALHHQPRSL